MPFSAHPAHILLADCYSRRDVVFCVYLAVGKTANHAIVMARLYSQAQFHGIHPFIVQVRDLTTHMPLPGTENNF